MRQYLTPDAANPHGRWSAVEFYNAGLDHYFLSTNPVEIDNLDSGRTVGWVRTGLRFLVLRHAGCRARARCAASIARRRSATRTSIRRAPRSARRPRRRIRVDWIYESPSVFYVQLPDTATGACPAGTRPVYRFFNTVTTNHRYTIGAA